MRYAAILFTAAALMLGSTAGVPAQDAPPLRAGDRIRIRIESPVLEPRRHEQDQLVRGDVVSVSAERLELRIHPDAGLVAIPFSAIRQLELSLGVPPASKRIPRRALHVAGIGALELVVLDQLYGDRALFGEAWQSAAAGAVLGAAIGGVLEAVFPQERWRRMRLPQ